MFALFSVCATGFDSTEFYFLKNEVQSFNKAEDTDQILLKRWQYILDYDIYIYHIIYPTS